MIKAAWVLLHLHHKQLTCACDVALSVTGAPHDISLHLVYYQELVCGVTKPVTPSGRYGLLVIQLALIVLRQITAGSGRCTC